MNEETEEIKQTDPEEYAQYYSDSGFWRKIAKKSRSIGRKFSEILLVLYYSLTDKETPKWAKSVIVGALGYFIFPVDAIPDFIPVIGFTDDYGMIMSAIAVIAAHIKDEHKDKARRITEKLFQ